MVRSLVSAIALACAAALFAGCATVINGTTQRVQIDSTPSGAEVLIDDSQQLVTTPATVKLSRRDSHKLVFHKPGYQDTTESLTSGMSGWILGNLIAGGVVGMAIDASDGAGRKLSADDVNVMLIPLPLPPPTDAAAVFVRHAQAAIPAHDEQPAAQPDDEHPVADQSAVAPARPEGPPLEDFTDDESGYARPAAQIPASQ
ncbi:MAG TPA: PEGA domain-containing protein [Candidatus Binataceae bacterium]|jgi:hypothetical protein|nr:PEGA domain-containing protein [Candidatus Binataceae bacterium]